MLIFINELRSLKGSKQDILLARVYFRYVLKPDVQIHVVINCHRPTVHHAQQLSLS